MKCQTCEVYSLSPITARWEERPSTERIIWTVCNELNVPYDNVFNKRRKRENVFARQLSMYFIKKFTFLKNKKIGLVFNRDRTTVIHSMQTVNDLIDTDEKIREQVYKIGHLLGCGYLIVFCAYMNL